MTDLKENLETGCCPRFNPQLWDNREIKLNNQLFVKDHVCCFFHIPLNFGKVIARSMDKVKKADAFASQPLWLSDEKSLWGSDLYIAVSKELPETEMARLSGNFLTKVFEGSYSQMGKWIKEMRSYVVSKNKELKKMYFFYTTCPKCAKVYGKNYVVILAEI